jgi:membrane protein required for beta-lactamase induction
LGRDEFTVLPRHGVRHCSLRRGSVLHARGGTVSVLALLLAILGERALTHLLHLREPRWLDRYYDWAARLFAGRGETTARVGAVVTILLPVLPVAVIDWLLGARLFGLPQLVFAIVVLLLSFGPRDLRDEVDDYVGALERGDRDEARRRATELLESDAAGRGGGLRVAVEEAIFVQANNRIFGVILWFMLLGPAGAWLFRVSDLLRRRAAFEAARHGGERVGFATALAFIHGLLAWIPARLAAAGYALAGSFEDAVGNWRAAVDRAASSLLDRSENLLARVGVGSLQPSLAGFEPAALDAATARGAWRIVARAAWIWLAVIALLVLAGTVA